MELFSTFKITIFHFQKIYNFSNFSSCLLVFFSPSTKRLMTSHLFFRLFLSYLEDSESNGDLFQISRESVIGCKNDCARESKCEGQSVEQVKICANSFRLL